MSARLPSLGVRRSPTALGVAFCRIARVPELVLWRSTRTAPLKGQPYSLLSSRRQQRKTLCQSRRLTMTPTIVMRFTQDLHPPSIYHPILSAKWMCSLLLTRRMNLHLMNLRSHIRLATSFS